MSSKEMKMSWMTQTIETCTSSGPQKYTSGKKKRKVTRKASFRERGDKNFRYV